MSRLATLAALLADRPGLDALRSEGDLLALSAAPEAVPALAEWLTREHGFEFATLLVEDLDGSLTVHYAFFHQIGRAHV